MKTSSATLLKLFVATLAVAAIVCFTANNTAENDFALRQDRNLSHRCRMLEGSGRGLCGSAPTPAPPRPPNAGGPGQNGIPFPQGFTLDDPFVPAGDLAAISFPDLQQRFDFAAVFAAFFGGN